MLNPLVAQNDRWKSRVECQIPALHSMSRPGINTSFYWSRCRVSEGHLNEEKKKVLFAKEVGFNFIDRLYKFRVVEMNFFLELHSVWCVT